MTICSDLFSWQGFADDSLSNCFRMGRVGGLGEVGGWVGNIGVGKHRNCASKDTLYSPMHKF